jgi:hypothetical protein
MSRPGSKALRKGRQSGPRRYYCLTKNLLDKGSELLTAPGHAEVAVRT